jgi:hypothetical protein
MIDQKNQYYPWQYELWAWEEARSKASGGRSSIEEPDTPPAKISNLLSVVRMARATPEVWNKFVELNDKLVSGAVKQADIDEGNSAESAEAVSLCSQFTNWFRMKNATNDSFLSYTSCSRVLKEMARLGGEMDDESIKAFFRGPFAIEEDV